MVVNNINEKDLLISIANGNELAFGNLFSRYKDVVYSIGLALTANTFDAEEVVQDVFSRIWTYKETLPNIKVFDFWIKTVARNRALTLLKKKAVEIKKRHTLSEFFPTEISNAEGKVQEKELQALISNAMGHLSPQQRKIFELSRLCGMDRQAIAKRLGLSSTTVSNHLSIALKTVRAYLYEHQYILIIFLLVRCYI